MNIRTTVSKPSEVIRSWYLLDAANLPIGRVAVKVANLLIGKHKPNYTPHVDGGDYVVVINAGSVVLTGRKSGESLYHYSGYPSGLKATPKGEILVKDPVRLLERAVYGMIPSNKLRPGRMGRLKIFADENHTHEAQKPKKLEMN